MYINKARPRIVPVHQFVPNKQAKEKKNKLKQARVSRLLAPCVDVDASIVRVV